VPHLRPLDGLRGAAVLAVVLYHFAPDLAPGGFLGVDVFFVLSGFLITSLLVHEREHRQAISLLRFWIRRARRLLPALVLVLLAVGTATLQLSDRGQARRVGIDSLATLGYVANWRFIWSEQSYVERILRTTPSPVRHTWSLAIEEQFYLAWPLIVVAVGAAVTAVARRRGTSGNALFRRSLVAVCAVVGAASLVRMVTLFSGTGDVNRVYYGTDSHAFLLLLGAGLGALSAGEPFVRARGRRRALVIAGGGAAVALVVAMATVDATTRGLYQGGYGVLGLVMLVVLAAAAQPGTNPLGALLSWSPLVGLGLISYGVYLWHWPAVVWLTADSTGLDGAALFAVRTAATLAVSLASYHLVEQPIRSGRIVLTRRSVHAFAAFGASTAMVVLLVVPAAFFPSVEAAPRVAPSTATRVATDQYAVGARCDESATDLEPLPAGTAPTVQLFGNSMAIEVRDCLATLVEARGGRLVSVVGSGVAPCLLLDELRAQVADPATRPDVAVFSARTFRVEMSCTGGDHFWLDQVQEAIDIWRQAGVQVYLVPIPPNVPGTERPYEGSALTVPAQVAEFEALAEADPAHVSVLDEGTFLRDARGVYQWRMPCLPGGEVGCDADGSIGVRWVDGAHFCTTPEWDGRTCIEADRGGERRAGAAIARQITELGLEGGVASLHP
jgi:peptidoglycan/LPS O-acetylase OafA/YrhL